MIDEPYLGLDFQHVKDQTLADIMVTKRLWLIKTLPDLSLLLPTTLSGGGGGGGLSGPPN